MPLTACSTRFGTGPEADPDDLLEIVPYEVERVEKRLGIYDAPPLYRLTAKPHSGRSNNGVHNITIYVHQYRYMSRWGNWVAYGDFTIWCTIFAGCSHRLHSIVRQCTDHIGDQGTWSYGRMSIITTNTCQVLK